MLIAKTEGNSSFNAASLAGGSVADGFNKNFFRLSEKGESLKGEVGIASSFEAIGGRVTSVEL